MEEGYEAEFRFSTKGTRRKHLPRAPALFSDYVTRPVGEGIDQDEEFLGRFEERPRAIYGRERLGSV